MRLALRTGAASSGNTGEFTEGEHHEHAEWLAVGLFGELDTNGDGTLDKAEVWAGLSKRGVSVPDKEYAPAPSRLALPPTRVQETCGILRFT